MTLKVIYHAEKFLVLSRSNLPKEIIDHLVRFWEGCQSENFSASHSVCVLWLKRILPFNINDILFFFFLDSDQNAKKQKLNDEANDLNENLTPDERYLTITSSELMPFLIYRVVPADL